MLDVMGERKTSVLRVLTDISEAKSLSDGDPTRSLKDTSESPISFEEVKTFQHTKRLLQKKNQLHPLFANHPYRCASMYGPRANSSRPKLKDVSQRIVSAKLLQIKELRNQLTLTQHQLNEVTNENRFLKTLQKRQEIALRKYEGHEARLPQLIQSHNEEVRILTSKFKQLKHTNQRLVEKLKAAEQQLSSLQEQHCHLVELSRDQQLGERELLASQVQDLQHTVHDQNNTVQLLTRKVDLERKNYKHELGLERSKRNDVERKLVLAMQTIENLKDQIEAKEKFMSAIVPSRYVRTSHSSTQQTLPSARITHSQIPRTPPTQKRSHNYKNIDKETPPRSSTDQTGDDTDNTESRNGNITSDNTKTISGTTLPKIKQQITNRNPRSHYKLSSKRLVNNERSSVNNDTPDYSSSFQSEDSSLRDLRKNSELEKLTQSNGKTSYNCKRNTSRNRKFSIDSGTTNKSESSRIADQTDQSRASSTKSRRNSISVCPTTAVNAQEVEQYLEQESLAVKIENHKSIREELRELEEKLLQGSSFLDRSRNQKTIDNQAEDSTKEKFTNMVDKSPSQNASDEEIQENLGNMTWEDTHEKIKADSEAAEAKLEEYYSNLEKNEFNLEGTENYISLEEEQKERLLKALQDIDKEAQGVSSASSTENNDLLSNQKPTRRKSDGYRYSFSKHIDNLHKGRPSHDKIKIPVVEKMRKEEKEYFSDVENSKKNKASFMKDLFRNYEDVSFQNGNFPTPDEQSKELDRLVQFNRTFD